MKIRKILNKFLSMALIIVMCLSTNITINAQRDAFSVSDVIKNDEIRVTVRGYIVGEPVSNTKINTERFRNDYAIAIADSLNETDTSKMLYVKVDKAYRSAYGLKSNSNLIGKPVSITGAKETYFNHEGIKNISNISILDSINLPTETENKPETNQPETVTQPTSRDTTGDYYASAYGKKGEALKSALNDIIDNHKELSYGQVWVALRDTDEDPNNPNNVILLYTGKSKSKYDNGGGINDWNREHVWAKSHGDFGTSMGAGTDLHHLRPTDVTVNSSRGNKNFDDSLYRHSEATECYYDSDSFEPRDEVKGDVARMIFYMATRYEGEHGEVDLEVVDYMNNTKSPYHGKLSTLLEWNRQDPVSETERRRNEKIYSNWQGNRNPFIDHPEWVEAIWN